MSLHKMMPGGIRLKRILTIMLITTFSIGVIGLIAFEELALPYMPIVPWKRTANETPADYALQSDSINLEVEKGLILRGYFIHSVLPKAKGTMILVHGIGGFKEGYLPFSRILAEIGFNVIIYDQRAHGKSGGQYCTFGYYEKNDVSQLVNIAQKYAPNLPVGIHGSSLGGAVALQALEVDKRIKFGIIESTFNTLENVVIEYGRDYFKFRSQWLAQRVLSKAAIIAQFKPFEIRPIDACKNIEQPILMFHGDADEKIPIEFNKENFAALKSSDKEFITVHGAGHHNVSAMGGNDYLNKIFSFLNRQMTTLK